MGGSVRGLAAEHLARNYRELRELLRRGDVGELVRRRRGRYYGLVHYMLSPAVRGELSPSLVSELVEVVDLNPVSSVRAVGRVWREGRPEEVLDRLLEPFSRELQVKVREMARELSEVVRVELFPEFVEHDAHHARDVVVLSLELMGLYPPRFRVYDVYLVVAAALLHDASMYSYVEEDVEYDEVRDNHSLYSTSIALRLRERLERDGVQMSDGELADICALVRYHQKRCRLSREYARRVKELGEDVDSSLPPLYELVLGEEEPKGELDARALGPLVGRGPDEALRLRGLAAIFKLADACDVQIARFRERRGEYISEYLRHKMNSLRKLQLSKERGGSDECKESEKGEGRERYMWRQVLHNFKHASIREVRVVREGGAGVIVVEENPGFLRGYERVREDLVRWAVREIVAEGYLVLDDLRALAERGGWAELKRVRVEWASGISEDYEVEKGPSLLRELPSEKEVVEEYADYVRENFSRMVGRSR